MEQTLRADRGVILGRWNAEPHELFEITDRLVAGGEVLEWPNEHMPALYRQLVRLREDRALAARPAAPGDFPADCDACGGSGVAVVPHRRCVSGRRVVLHPEQRAVVTVGVLCDRGGCEAGRSARDREQARKTDRPRATLSRAEMFHGCDLVALLREFEREQARRSRATHDGSRDEWARLLESIKRRAAGHADGEAA